jgi:ribosome-associated protein
MQIPLQFLQTHQKAANRIPFMLFSSSYRFSTLNDKNHTRRNPFFTPKRYSSTSRKVPDATEAADLQKIKQMNEYFNQYVEEYYEVDEEEEEIQFEEISSPSIAHAKRPLTELDPEEIVDVLKSQRAKNIICLQVPAHAGPHPYVVICSPHNRRHAEALTHTIRKHVLNQYVFPESSMPQHVRNDGGWYMFDMRKVLIHVMTEEARKKYDLESLWGIGEDNTSVSSFNLLVDDEFIPPPRLTPTSS